MNLLELLFRIALTNYVFFSVQYVIPLCVITFAYVHMAKKLWGARAPGNAQEIRDANQMKNKKKVRMHFLSHCILRRASSCLYLSRV